MPSPRSPVIDRRNLLVLEPAEQPPQLRAEDRGVVQPAKEGLDRVQHNALGADRINGVAQPDEEAFEVILAGLLDLAPLDVDVVHQEFVLADQLLQVEAEGADVLGQVLGRLLKGHEDTGLAELGRAANEELRREQSLSATRAAAHERGTAARQTAAGDFIESLDAGRSLGERTALPVAAYCAFAHQFLREFIRPWAALRVV